MQRTSRGHFLKNMEFRPEDIMQNYINKQTTDKAETVYSSFNCPYAVFSVIDLNKPCQTKITKGDKNG